MVLAYWSCWLLEHEKLAYSIPQGRFKGASTERLKDGESESGKKVGPMSQKPHVTGPYVMTHFKGL